MEFFTAVHKTGRSAAKKATLLPILCPAIGVNGNNWVVSTMTIFEKAGLSFCGEIQRPVLCPPSHEGPFLCRRGVSSTEVGKLLRGLVGENSTLERPFIEGDRAFMIGSFWHGMADRAILGRHQSHTNETVAVYANLAGGFADRRLWVLVVFFWLFPLFVDCCTYTATVLCTFLAFTTSVRTEPQHHCQVGTKTTLHRRGGRGK